MDDANTTAKSSTFPAIAPATRAAKRCALAIMITLIAAFCALIPFARAPLPGLQVFIPIFDSMIVLNSFFAAGSLLAGFNRSRLITVFLLALCYAFTYFMTLTHLLMFSGLFAWGGQLNGGGWLDRFSSGGFSLFVIGYALLRKRNIGLRPRTDKIFCVISVALSAICLMILFAAASYPLRVPRTGGSAMSIMLTHGPALMLALTALMVLVTRSLYSILDLWLLVVTCAWVLSVVLTDISYPGYLDLGLAAGYFCRLVAASILPLVLLVEAGRVARHLDEALALAEERNTELARSRQELARAQRLEAVGQLTGGIAHDFNNLLTIIIGNLELILRAHGETKKIDRFAQAAIKAAQRGGHLVTQLLTYARRQINRPQTLNLNQLITNVENLMQRVISKQIEVVTRLSPVLAPVRIDPTQFETALLNLAINSRDAMAEGGRITIETTNMTVDQQQADNDIEMTPGPYVVVTVSDTGTGMTPAVLEKAFDPFFTTKEFGKGSGLGLSQVYGFAKTAGGHVKINSELGAGTIVKLYLPQSPDRAALLDYDAGKMSLRPGPSCGTILVVEDDEEVLAVTAESLREIGYQVLSAVNAMQALRILDGDQAIDLLFSDVILPGGINGAQLAEKARQLRPDLKVLLTSGYTAAALSSEYRLPDDLDVVGKPYQREELATKLRLVMAGCN